MVHRISLSQLQSQLRQAEYKWWEAINKINQAVRNYEQRVNRAIDNYNQEVRAHNVRARANRQRIVSVLARLQNQSHIARFTVLRSSVNILHSSYLALEHRAQQRALNSEEAVLIDLSEQENANSLEVMSNLLGNGSTTDPNPDEFENSLGNELIMIAPDLDRRWKGALFALNPNNPDAARHFCSSSREIFTQVLETGAPDSDVISLFPDCALTDQGRPTRRSKIEYCLQLKDMNDVALAQFVDHDVENIVSLSRVLNDGTHGSAGVFDLPTLRSIKKRVEDGIRFLSKIVRR